MESTATRCTNAENRYATKAVNYSYVNVVHPRKRQKANRSQLTRYGIAVVYARPSVPTTKKHDTDVYYTLRQRKPKYFQEPFF